MVTMVRCIGHVWMVGVGVLIFLCGASIIWVDGLVRFWEIFCPWNIWNMALICVMLLPGLMLYRLADRLKKKI